jgi:hypothetical protein
MREGVDWSYPLDSEYEVLEPTWSVSIRYVTKLSSLTALLPTPQNTSGAERNFTLFLLPIYYP